MVHSYFILRDDVNAAMNSIDWGEYVTFIYIFQLGGWRPPGSVSKAPENKYCVLALFQGSKRVHCVGGHHFNLKPRYLYKPELLIDCHYL